MSRDGKVIENFAARLQSVAHHGTGYLELHDTARERRGWVFLENQEVVAVLVAGYQPRLARRLIASEFVSVADMGEVLSVTKDEYDPRIAVECVARGLVDAVTMKVLYREFMLSAASFVDEWELGESQWVAGIPPWEGRSTAVAVPLLVNAISRRKEHWATLWTELSAVTIPDRIPMRTGRADYRPDSPDEAAVLRAIDGERTLDQVAGECGFTRFQTGHLMAALMAKKVLDLFPVHGRRCTDSAMRVDAGYYPMAEPVPDLSVPATDVRTTDRPSGRVDPPAPWVVPMTPVFPHSPQAHPEPTHENTQVTAIGPVTVDVPEGNVVHHQAEVEDVVGGAGTTQAFGGEGLVAPERSSGGPDQPQAASLGEEPVAATDETVGELSGEPDSGTEVPGLGEPTETSQAATEPGELFVSSAPPLVAVPDGPPATAVVQQYSLPPLPAFAGARSELHPALPSTPPRGTGGLPTATPGLRVVDPAHAEPMAAPVTGPVAELGTGPVGEQVAGLLAELLAAPLAEHPTAPAADHEPAGSNHRAPGTSAEQSPDLRPDKEAAAGPGVERDGVDRGMEVTRLRDELLRLAAQRAAAIEHAAVLHEQAALQSTQADAAAVLVEETGRSVARLTTVTSQALAITVSQREGLELARREDARIAALRAQIDEDGEKARKALVLGQHKFDESSAAHANLERDLLAEMARREAVREEWTAATDSVVRSAADARDAQVVADECDLLIEEARKRLTELANAER